MRDEQFDIPVTVETARIGRSLTVTRTAQAADFLVNKWPEPRGPKYRKALQAVMDALEQRKRVDTARRAFTAAAKESDIFIPEGRTCRRGK